MTVTAASPAPSLAVQRRSSSDAPGYIFVAPKGGTGQQGPEIFDDRGRPVWFDPMTGDHVDKVDRRSQWRRLKHQHVGAIRQPWIWRLGPEHAGRFLLVHGTGRHHVPQSRDR